jgi:hypothetical protein
VNEIMTSGQYKRRGAGMSNPELSGLGGWFFGKKSKAKHANSSSKLVHLKE